MGTSVWRRAQPYRSTIESGVARSYRGSASIHIALLLLGLLVPGPNPAEAQPTCSLSQITRTSDGANLFPKLDHGGQRLVFQSTADLVPGGNPDGSSEIFLYNVLTETFDQLTGAGDLDSGRPDLAGSGTAIAFLSDADLVPGRNLDGSTEVFVLELATGLQQVTEGSTFVNVSSPSIDFAGSRITFSSTGDPVSGENVDGNREVFLWDRIDGLRQITFTTAGTVNSGPQISGDGRRIVFRSNGDLTPPTNAGGQEEVFIWEEEAGFLQITSGISDSLLSPPILDYLGRRIGIGADGDPFGENPDGFVEVFLHDEATGLRQLTSTGLPSEPEALSSDGSRMLILSVGDLEPGKNPDQSLEVFLYDSTPGAFTQITDDLPWLTDFRGGDLSGNGKRAAFFSLRDHLPGENPEGNPEIFLADCAEPSIADVPASGPLHQLLLVVGLTAGACYLLSRRL